jgi:hypothetical protein
MEQATGRTRGSPLERLRGVRDKAMDAWARVVLRTTGSRPYARASHLATRPGLVALGIARAATRRWMAWALSELNMPSRADVLALSVRLTHVETTLDDLGAAVDELRSASASRRPARDGRGATARNGPGARARNGRRPRAAEARP